MQHLFSYSIHSWGQRMFPVRGERDFSNGPGALYVDAACIYKSGVPDARKRDDA